MIILPTMVAWWQRCSAAEHEVAGWIPDRSICISIETKCKNARAPKEAQAVFLNREPSTRPSLVGPMCV